MHKIIRSLWLFIVLLSASAHAVAKTEFQEGKDYRVLKTPAQTSVKSDRIEVAEVFWYGCPHCYSLESVVDRWKPSLSEEAQFIRVPGFFGQNIWQTHARLYYTLESLYPDEKELHPVHDAVFKEIQEKNNRLTNSKDMTDFLGKRFKVDKDRFEEYFKSFGVQNLLNQAFSKVRGYRLTGVPVLVVDGRYVIEPGIGLENMPRVADYLIQKISDERAKEKAEKNKSAESREETKAEFRQKQSQ